MCMLSFIRDEQLVWIEARSLYMFPHAAARVGALVVAAWVDVALHHLLAILAPPGHQHHRLRLASQKYLLATDNCLFKHMILQMMVKATDAFRASAASHTVIIHVSLGHSAASLLGPA